MPRHVQITHVCVMEVPDDFYEADDKDAVLTRGIQIMEEFIQGRAPRIVEVTSSWAEMPKQYSSARAAREGPSFEQIPVVTDPDMPPGEVSLRAGNVELGRVVNVGSGREEGQISFVGDVVPAPGVTHPWEQGLWIFPEDHPYHEYEIMYRRKWQEQKDQGHKQLAHRQIELMQHQIEELDSQKPKELGS